MKIAAVRVEGATHTRRSFLGFVVNPLLARPDAAGSLEAVLKTTKRISHRLHETDVFQRLEARIERARDVLADPDAVDIVLRAKERGRLYLNSSTELGNNEGSAVGCLFFYLFYFYLFYFIYLLFFFYRVERDGTHSERFWRR